jgi:hypothetical protein
VIKTELPKFGYQVNPIYRIYLTGYNVPEITLFINRVEDGKLLSSKTLKALIKRATGVIGGLRSTLIELIHDSDIDSWIKREMDV